MKKCQKCGAICSEQDQYCGKCGEKLTKEQITEKMQNEKANCEGKRIEKKKKKGKIRGLLLTACAFGIVLILTFIFTSGKTGDKKKVISGQPTVFTEYLQYSGQNYKVLGDDFTEVNNDDQGDERIHHLVKQFDELPGEWYISYFYYNDVQGNADDCLTAPSLSDNKYLTDLDETEKALEKIYGTYDEYYENPIDNSSIPYSCYQWNSVENGEYSLSLITLEDEGQHYILFGKACNQIEQKKLAKALKKEVRKEFGFGKKVEINQCTRLNSNYVVMIWTNDMKMSLDSLTEKNIPSDYVWIDFDIETGKETRECNAILQCVDGKWKIFGKIKEID